MRGSSSPAHRYAGEFGSIMLVGPSNPAPADGPEVDLTSPNAPPPEAPGLSVQYVTTPASPSTSLRSVLVPSLALAPLSLTPHQAIDRLERFSQGKILWDFVPMTGKS